MRSVIAILVLVTASASADDRASCGKGDRNACARIGRLKQLGALKADGTRDVDVLIEGCGKALDGAKGPDAFDGVARACSLLFNADLQKAWDVLGSLAGSSGVDQMLATGYAEAYCSGIAEPVTGCNGKRAANFSSMKGAAVRTALSALNGAALDKELGADKAKPLAAKFDAAWAHLLAK